MEKEIKMEKREKKGQKSINKCVLRAATKAFRSLQRP